MYEIYFQLKESPNIHFDKNSKEEGYFGKTSKIEKKKNCLNSQPIEQKEKLQDFKKRMIKEID